MLAVFDKSVAQSPEALQSPHSDAVSALKDGFLARHFATVNPSSVTVNLGSSGFMAYSLDRQNPLLPRSDLLSSMASNEFRFFIAFFCFVLVFVCLLLFGVILVVLTLLIELDVSFFFLFWECVCFLRNFEEKTRIDGERSNRNFRLDFYNLSFLVK